ncbi:hypothetical protein [Enterobacter ludwigii]|uniref:hypothetical protein n=1 Tax=Enterobacter ludwigii TaxID=299767 RepID=UPI001E2B7A9F|nr:hypothetical protein [Enterobacter ludwigii]MCE2009144.1 hypothetical protein [Enterobacter ludwigii]
MTDNPFTKVVKETLYTTSKIDRAIADLEKYLSQASEALNSSIDGKTNIKLTTDVSGTTLRTASTLALVFSPESQKGRKFIYITNGVRSELIAGWTINENAESMTLTINKLKSTYPVSEEGFIKSITELLATTSIMDIAVRMSNQIF